MNEPWFRWSIIYGIEPIHKNGWTLIGLYFVFAIPSGLMALGLLEYQNITRPIGIITFLAVSLGFFGKIFSRME